MRSFLKLNQYQHQPRTVRNSPRHRTLSGIPRSARIAARQDQRAMSSPHVIKQGESNEEPLYAITAQSFPASFNRIFCRYPARSSTRAATITDAGGAASFSATQSTTRRRRRSSTRSDVHANFHRLALSIDRAGVYFGARDWFRRRAEQPFALFRAERVGRRLDNH